MSIQITLRISDDIDEKLRETGHSLQTNRQGAISHILQMYYMKEYSSDSAKILQ